MLSSVSLGAGLKTRPTPPNGAAVDGGEGAMATESAQSTEASGGGEVSWREVARELQQRLSAYEDGATPGMGMVVENPELAAKAAENSELMAQNAELRKKNLEGSVESAGGMPFWMHALLQQMLRAKGSGEGGDESSTGRDSTFNRRLIIGRLAYNLTQQELRGIVPVSGAPPAPAGGAAGGGSAATAAPPAGPPSFERHATSWARPLLQLVFDSLLGQDACFHYLARDLLCLVTGWQRAYAASALSPRPRGAAS